MELQSWGKLYQELASKVSENIESIKWVDLWHNQVGFLVEEHPFPTPAVFMAFRILSVEDLSEKVQRVQLQIDMYYFYETFLDTYQGAYNEDDALDYLEDLTAIYKLFHASSGNNYSEMRRTGLAAVDTGSSGNLYRQTFTCSTVDASALTEFDVVVPGSIEYNKGAAPEDEQEPHFKIPLIGGN
ncbi:hypothetical protein MC378_10355 [Polaribacter sp. MSW13]|uniref:Uncharacterized protein n=1 Tax=Polaribacter marinus TaxID=2916838 RepID=A0A9X1VN30_9FLAO|nr:hypothetical protein [Polaribacter marinus]MCI2229569.1 hypothetical protein [Polaribacter marinus]